MEINKGDEFTVNVTRINSNSAWTKEIRGDYVSKEYYGFYVTPTTLNNTYWEEKAEIGSLRQDNTYEVDGDLFIHTKDQEQMYEKIVRNWKTGWLVSRHYRTLDLECKFEVKNGEKGLISLDLIMLIHLK